MAPVNRQDPTYRLRHSVAHVMAQAVKEMFPEAKLGWGQTPEGAGYAPEGMRARTVVPKPGELDTSSVPPRRAALSRIERRPRWPGKSAPASDLAAVAPFLHVTVGLGQR